MKSRAFFTASLSFPLASALASLLALSATATAQTNNYFGTAGTLTGSVWSTIPAGPYTSALNSTGGAIINFGNATTTVTGASITVAGINATANAAITTIGGTISNQGNAVIPIDVANAITLNFGTQSFTSSATAGYIKNGAGTLALAGNTYGGGFTLNAGTVALTGVNGMGGGATNTLTINGGTIRSSGTAARDLSGKYAGGITVGGDFALGDSTNNGVLTFTNTMALGAANRTITANSAVTLGSVISGGSGIGITKAGAGTLTLTGASNYTGVTTITGGILNAANASALGVTSADTVVAPGGALFLGTVNLSIAEPINLTGNGPASNGALQIGGGVAGMAFTGAITLGGAATISANGGTGSTLSGGINIGTHALTFNADGGATSTIGTNGITGTGGSLTKTGSGTLVLSAASTFTGATTINAGVLSLGNLNPLPNTSGITMATGSTLRSTISGVVVSAPITTTGSVTINAPNNNAGAVSSELILNGAIGGAGTTNVTFSSILNANTVQTVTLGAANTYSGTTTITTSATTLTNTAYQMFVKLGATDALPTTTVLNILGGEGTGSGRGIGLNLFGYNQTLAGLTNTPFALRVQEIVNSDASPAATLTINGSSPSTYSGNLGRNTAGFSVSPIAVPGSTNGNNFGLTKDGSGTFTISGVNLFQGATKILGGILSLGNASALSQSPLDTLNSIAGNSTNGLQSTVTTLTLGGLTGNKDLASVFTTTGGYNAVTALTLNPVTGATHGYSGAIADGAAGMTLTKTGAGAQILGGANSFTGATAINAGSLTLDYSTQDNSKLSDTAALTLGAVTLDLSGGSHLEVVASTTLAPGTASKVTRSSGSAILQMNAITTGALSSIDFSAAAIATTDTPNNAYGILGPWATIGGTDFAVNFTNGPDGLITAPTSTDVTRLNGGTQIIADSAAANVRIIEGTGSPANITLAAATTTINTLTQSASGGNGAATIDSGSQTLLTNAILVGTGAGDLTIGNGTLATATTGGDLALVNTTAGGFTVNSVIADNTTASTLSKLGTGMVTLTSANTFTGTMTISAGILQLGTGGTTGTLATTGAIVLANSGNLTVNRSNAVTQGTDFSTAPITGTGSFTQAGAGITTLNALNTYSGLTTLGAGTLIANSTDALGSGVAGNTLVFNGGILQASGAIISPSTRAVSLTSTAVIDTNGNSISFAGGASGAGGLTKNGAGALTFSALNSFTGPIAINGGELVFSSGSTGAVYASTQININNGATLRITGASGNQTIYDGRNYTFDSGGGGSILVSTGNYNAVSTPFSITTNGGAANTIGLITTSGANGFNLGSTVATFNVALGSDANSDLTIAPNISNNGSIVKTGAGRLTFTGANTFSGGTTINAGTLRLSGGAALTGLVTIANAAGATLQVVTTEGINALTGGGATGGAVSIDAAQTLNLANGTQTFSGTVSGAGTLANTGAFQTLNGALSQGGGVNVTDGVLTLGNASNSYTGSTVISAGKGLLVTANGALGAVGTGNETTVTGGAAATGGQLGFSGGITYSALEKVTGSGLGSFGTPFGPFAAAQRGFIQSVSGNNTFAGNIELSANGLSRIGTQDGAQLTLAGAITQASGITTANILFRAGGSAGDFVTLSNAGNAFGGDSTVFTTVSTPGNYAGVRLGITNGLPTNLTISGFASTGSGAALDLAGFDQTLNGLITGGSPMSIVNMNTGAPSTLTLTPTVNKSSTNTLILGGGGLGVINVVKDGALSQTLAGVYTYTGNTTVNAGTLALADNAQLRFVTGATSGTNNSISGVGTLTIDGDFVIDTTLTDASALTTGSWTLVDATTLVETFNPSFTILGAGWSEAANVWTRTVGSKKYTFTEATGILTLSPGASYASWINGFFPGVTNPLIIGTTADPDSDGIANGVEMVLGGNPATGMDAALLPTIELVTNPVSTPAIPAGDYLLFTYRRTDLSAAAGVAADCVTDTDLVAPWTAATGAPGVVIQVDDNYASFSPPATDTDRVRVYVPRAANTKLFGRLDVQVPTP